MAARPSPDAPQKQWDAWWNRELRNQALPSIAPAEAKAETGPGLFALQGFPMLNSLSGRPEKLIAEAEALFHTNVWVASAERAIVSRFASVEYHLEDDNDESVDGSSPLAASLIEVLNRPSARRSRRQLWSITARHMGLTGNAFWYLSGRELLGNTPLECLYINPARMTPVSDADDTLLGWIMDHPQNPLTPAGVTGTPFDLDEIIHFVLDEPDWGHYGIGIAETAQAKIELSRVSDRHTAQTFAAGGRLAGIISPKAGGATISDDGWQAVIRDYRNIMADPDSYKRVQVMRSPIDFTATTGNPTELQLTDVMTASRDDILAAWQVPLSQLGVVSARGLNSGDIPKFEEAQLWQGPIDARLSPFVEKLQSELIDRWAKLGLTVHIEVETPEFDDQAPMFVNAEKAAKVPMTVDERRALVGDDPLDEADYGKLGSAIFMDQSMVRLDEGAAPVQPPSLTPPPVAQEQIAEPEPLKASALQTLRHRVEIRWEPRIRKVVLAALSEAREELASRVASKHSHLLRKPSDTAVWWNTERERRRLRDAIEPLVLQMAREVADRASEKYPAKAMASDWQTRLAASIRLRIGERLAGIADTTRDDIARLVEVGISSGQSPVELGAAIRAATTFGEARAEMISRTETMFAYNDAALSTYRELGSEQVQAIDGDLDDECAFRDGRTYSVDEAYGITDHPNGTLDWIPIVPAKAIVEERPSAAVWAGFEEMARMAKAASIPIPTPVVNVAPPPPAVINVNTESFTAGLERIEAILTAPKPKPRIDRDADGRIIGLSYE